MNSHPMSVLIRANQAVKPITDNAKVDAMLRILIEIPPSEQNDLWLRNDPRRVGDFCLFRHGSYPGVVLEYVQGGKQDSVTTLYQHSPEFSTRESAAALRRDLMREIAAVTLSIPDSIGIFDHGREREVFLREMGTAQLVDTLARALNVSLAAL